MGTMNDYQEQLLKAYAFEPDPIYTDAFRWTGVEPLDVANIATNLAPAALPHIGEKTHLYVVGYDSPNLTQDKYTAWEEFLAALCERGGKFTYFLGKRSDLATDRLKKIADKCHAKSGQIQAFSRNHKGTPLAESYADQWKTFHFAIFEEPRQMWIETNHPAGETKAFGCYYLPPEIAKDEPLLDIYKTRLQKVLEECASLDFQS